LLVLLVRSLAELWDPAPLSDRLDIVARRPATNKPGDHGNQYDCCEQPREVGEKPEHH